MKKIIILLLLLCIACVGLASCGDATTTVPEVMTTAAPTTTKAPITPEGPTGEGLAFDLNADGSGYIVTGMALVKVTTL